MDPAELRDLREIAALEVVAWGREAEEAEITKRTKRIEKELAALDPDAKAILLARRAGKVVGICRITRDDDGATWCLFGLAVGAEHRRQGIGGALAAACIDHARQRGANLIRSETHLDNTVSISFHEHIGFARHETFTDTDGDQKVPFRLSL